MNKNIGSLWKHVNAMTTKVDEALTTSKQAKLAVAGIVCYSEPTMSGVIKFKTENRRNAFLRSCRRAKNKIIEGDRKLRFSKKLTMVERAEEKRLGYVKNAINLSTWASCGRRRSRQPCSSA